jgi:hypothetical protein
MYSGREAEAQDVRHGGSAVAGAEVADDAAAISACTMA